jgi:hypothetical protein
MSAGDPDIINYLIWWDSELEYFGRMPASHVTPLLGSWGIVAATEAQIEQIDGTEWAEATEAVDALGFGIGTHSHTLLAYQDPEVLAQTGILIHEWHHAINYSYAAQSNEPWGTYLGRSSQSDFVALWNRVQTFWSTAPDNFQTFVGWQSNYELFAELGRTYWLGSAGGTPVSPYTGLGQYDTAPDSTFRQMISGYGVTSDDSYVLEARAIIAGAVPVRAPGTF